MDEGHCNRHQIMALETHKVKSALIIATTTFALDALFHKFLTEPMESFDYFTVKWLLAFFVATLYLNFSTDSGFWRGWKAVVLFSSVSSFLMSLYYRWWEFFSKVPYGERAPDIIFIDRTQILLFGGT